MAQHFEQDTRCVAETCVTDDIRVSTVFLGLDHNFSGHGPPLLFETMCFGGVCDGAQQRYATWHEAEQGHEAIVQRVRLALKP